MAIRDESGDTLLANARIGSASVTHLLAALLLVLHAGLAVHALSGATVTVDEVAHLPAGIVYWRTGSFGLYHHNPPLVKLLAALPALAQRPIVPPGAGGERTHFEFGFDFMYANAARYQQIYFWSRCVGVVISVLAGALLFLWGREAFGAGGGLLALTAWCLSPNVIAHAGLVTMDLGVTAGFVVASYAFWRYLRTPGPWRAVAAGAALGLALLAKFVAILLLPIFGSVALGLGGLRLVGRHRGPCIRLLPALRHAIGAGVAVIVVVNVGYGCEGTGRRLDSLPFVSAGLAAAPEARSDQRNRFDGSPLGAIRVPLPEHFVLGIDATRGHATGRYPAYLRGEWRQGAWRHYYLVALALKVPIGTWLLLGAAVCAALARARFRADPATELMLLVPPVVVVGGVSLFTEINLGLRYVLPALPFIFLWIARLGRASWRRPGLAWIIPAALVWNLVSVVRIHPHELAYFNALAGGPENGHRSLLDSNLDWGQDLHRLAHWLERTRPGETVGLAYFGGIDPGILHSQGLELPFRLAPPAPPDLVTLLGLAPTGRLAQRVDALWAAMRAGREPLPRALAGRAPSRLPARAPAALLLADPEVRAALGDAIGWAGGVSPGLYAVSANFLEGYPYRVRDEEGNLWRAAHGAFAYFAGLEPVARIGYSILVYELSETDAARLRQKIPLPRDPAPVGRRPPPRARRAAG